MMHTALNRRVCHANRSILAFALLGCAPVMAVEPAIRDNAGLFTGTALQEAEDRARRIRQSSGRDFVVETFSTIPDSLRPRLDRLGKEQFHSEWALSRSRELGVAGVYVQIVESPGRLEVAVGEQSELQFTAGDRERLRDIMLEYLRNRDFDRALREGVAFADARLSASGTGSRSEAPWGTGAGTTRTPLDTAPRGEQRPSWPGLGGSSIGRWICLGVALLAIFVIVRLFRRVGGALGRSGGGMFGGGAPRTGGMFGGGGFGRGILGGLLGGLLGGRLTRGGRTGGGFGGGFLNPRGPSSPGGSSRGRDSGTSGGDFGGSGRGGGGGRTSGGDF